MRYRPLGVHGQTVSAITLALGERPDAEAARVKLVYAALEAGVNSFELRAPAAAEALAQALQALERRMVVVTLRLAGSERLDRDGVLAAIEQPLLAGRFAHFDAVIVCGPARLTADGWEALEAAREVGRTRMLGVAGDGVDAALRRPGLDLLGACYHLGSVWADRNRIKTAVHDGRSVFGDGYYPKLDARGPDGEARRGLFGFVGKPKAIDRMGGYDFLRRTPNWAADEICLAYALTEPSLATVVVEVASPEDVERLAAVAERELPTGLAAQIEMARFAEAA